MMKMFTIPRIIITILFILCFVLNAISVGLCLSALFLLILAYLDLGHLLGEMNAGNGGGGGGEPVATYFPSYESSTSVSSIIDDDNNTEITANVSSNLVDNITTTTTSVPLFTFHQSEPLLPESNPDQLNLIFYLLFYLAVAILGLMGATRRYRTNKITYLTCHVVLLSSIICFNLLAWFHFRTYSPLSKTSSEDPSLLLASLFDFVDLLVGFLLLISLIINNRYNIGLIKQRNSITPITNSPNGSSQSSYTIA